MNEIYIFCLETAVRDPSSYLTDLKSIVLVAWSEMEKSIDPTRVKSSWEWPKVGRISGIAHLAPKRERESTVHVICCSYESIVLLELHISRAIQ